MGMVGRGSLDSPHLWTRRAAEHAPCFVCACSVQTRGPAPPMFWRVAGDSSAFQAPPRDPGRAVGRPEASRIYPRSWTLEKRNRPMTVCISFTELSHFRSPQRACPASYTYLIFLTRWHLKWPSEQKMSNKVENAHTQPAGFGWAK